MRNVNVAGRVAELAELLTPAERRVAHQVLTRPELVAFGTVAELAAASGEVQRLFAAALYGRLHDGE